GRCAETAQARRYPAAAAPCAEPSMPGTAADRSAGVTAGEGALGHRRRPDEGEQRHGHRRRDDGRAAGRVREDHVAAEDAVEQDREPHRDDAHRAPERRHQKPRGDAAAIRPGGGGLIHGCSHDNLLNHDLTVTPAPNAPPGALVTASRYERDRLTSGTKV